MDTVEEMEVRCEDTAGNECAGINGTELERVRESPRGPATAFVVCEVDVGVGEGLDLRRRDISSLSVVKVNGAWSMCATDPTCCPYKKQEGATFT